VRAFLVLHGYTNRRPPGHWHRRLVEALRAGGELAVYPAMPDTDDPSLQVWLETVRTELDLLGDPTGTERVVVAHSLAAVVWLHLAQQGLLAPVDRVLLVAPPGPSRLERELGGFVLPPLDPARVRSAARDTLVVCSDDDPWCPEGVVETYAEPLGLRSVVIPGARHFALGDGFGPWPAVVGWARDPASTWA
jgi:predicted alpha/beta hydrolase family esterase